MHIKSTLISMKIINRLICECSFCSSQSESTIVSDKESVNLTGLSDLIEHFNIIRNFGVSAP